MVHIKYTIVLTNFTKASAFLNREKTLYTWEKQIINDTSSNVHFFKVFDEKEKTYHVRNY